MVLALGCFQWILDFKVDRTPLLTTEKKMQQVNLNIQSSGLFVLVSGMPLFAL